MSISSGVVSDIQLPVASSTSAAWCSSTNLLAVATTSQATSASVIVLEPSCPQDHCVLNIPLKGSNDVIKSLSWSPLHSRHALLVASQQGGLWVWTQIPPDIPGTPHVPCTNQWYSQQLDPPFTTLDVQMTDLLTSDTEPGAGLVAASWLTSPSPYKWSTRKIASEPLPAHMDDLFLGPRHTPPGSVVPRHWVRPATLAAAVIDSQAGCRLYTATLGRYPNQMHWQTSARIPLIPPLDILYHVTAACVIAANTGNSPGVRVALLGAKSPTTIHICNVIGDPMVQDSKTLLAHQHLTSVVIECIDVMSTPLPHPGITPTTLAFSHTMSGLGLYVMGTAPDAQLPGAHVSHVLMCQEHHAAVTANGAPTWVRSAQHVYCAHGRAEPGSFVVSADCSKFALITNNNTLHVLSTEDHAVLHLRTLDTLDAPPAPTSNNSSHSMTHSSSNPVITTAVFSPTSSCVAVVSSQQGGGAGVGPGGVKVELDGAGAPGQAATQLDMSRVKILAVPELLLGTSPSQLFSSPTPSPCWTPYMDMSDPGCEAHARLDAARLLLGLHTCCPLWCLVQRVVALSQHHAGWVYAFRCLAVLDDMMQAEDTHPRPTLSQLADRVKIAVLRCVPGYSAACVASDLVARQYVSCLYQVLTTCVQMPADGSNPASARTISPVEAASVKSYLSWFGDYVQLMLASFKAWSAARSALPQQLFPRAPHAQQSQQTESEIAESAATVAEEEGAGAAWAYLQEVYEAGGPLTAEEAAVALPCVRLLLDRKFLTNMRYCMHVWSSVRARPSSGLAGGDDKETEEAAEARHNHNVTIKQLFTSVEGLLSLGNVKQEGASQSQLGRQPLARELAHTLATLYPGRAQVHAGRCTLVSIWAHLQPLLSSPGVLSAPTLTPRQILARARELGLLLSGTTIPTNLDQPIDHRGVLSSWHACRRQAPPTSQHQDLLLLDAHMTFPTHPDAATAKNGQETATTTDLLHSLSSPGGSLSPGRVTSAQSAKKRSRWYQQRAVSLAFNDPSNAQSEPCQRSGVGGRAVEAHLPVLDVLSGVLLHPELSVWSTEIADGSGATAQLEESYLQVVGQQAASVQFLRKAWISVCPVTQTPWKRVKSGVAQEATVPVW